MKVSNAKICLDCDELFVEDICPRCLNSISVPLKKWFPALIDFPAIREAVLDAKKKQTPSDPRHIVPFIGVGKVFASIAAAGSSLAAAWGNLFRSMKEADKQCQILNTLHPQTKR
jgi:hypothetical protein